VGLILIEIYKCSHVTIHGRVADVVSVISWKQIKLLFYIYIYKERESDYCLNIYKWEKTATGGVKNRDIWYLLFSPSIYPSPLSSSHAMSALCLTFLAPFPFLHARIHKCREKYFCMGESGGRSCSCFYFSIPLHSSIVFLIFILFWINFIWCFFYFNMLIYIKNLD